MPLCIKMDTWKFQIAFGRSQVTSNGVEKGICGKIICLFSFLNFSPYQLINTISFYLT